VNYQAWTAVTNVTLPAASTSVVIRLDLPPATPFLVFRAVTSGGPPVVARQPELDLSLSAGGLKLDLTGGDAGQTYAVEKTLSLGTPWSGTPHTVVADPAGSGSVVIPPVVGEPNAFFRAVRR